MATSSIFDKFIIDSDKKMEIFLGNKKDENKKTTRKIPKIDILKKIENGKEVLKTF
jgi:hypothetical protein